jgi:hypothetical protein
MIQLCRHILASNQQCAQPAQNGKHFCRHHRGINAWRRHSGHTSAIPTQSYDHGTMLVPEPRVYPPLELEFPEDRASIQINLYRIIDRLARGLMDRSTATALMYGMQVSQTNLGKMPLLESAPASPSRSRSQSDNDDSESTTATPSPLRTVSRVILTPEGDEIAPPVEILEPNEAEPIHHKGCPCLLCAEKYRNQPPEEHHPACQCGLCEEAEGTEQQESAFREQGSDEGSGLRALGTEYRAEHSAQRSATTNNDVILSEAREACEVEGPAVTQPATIEGAPSFANRGPHGQVFVRGVEARRVGSQGPDTAASSLAQQGQVEERGFSPAYQVGPKDRTALPQAGRGAEGETPLPRKRIAHASALLSGSTNRDPLNRPWSIAEYTFGDAVRRHEAQYAARAAAALAVGIEPPPYEPFVSGLIRPGTPEWEEDQHMQHHSSEYWAAHFRKQIADRPDIQQYLEEEAGESGSGI